MIDMVFLLLVFFMTVSTIAKESRPELELAVSSTAVIPEAAPPRDFITIIMDDDYTCFWNNRRIRKEQLPELLATRGKAGGEQVILRGGPELPWEVWQDLLKLCQQANVAEVIFATYED